MVFLILGTLKKGSILVTDIAMSKVRTIKDADGRQLSQVSPGYPAEVDGWKDLPPAGEIILEVENEKQAKAALRARQVKKLKEKEKEDAVIISAKEEQHLREYREKLKLKRSLGRGRLKPTGPRKSEMRTDEGGTAELNLVIKCDVDGTLEAILNVFDTYNSTNCSLDLIHYGVGGIGENDVNLRKPSKG